MTLTPAQRESLTNNTFIQRQQILSAHKRIALLQDQRAYYIALDNANQSTCTRLTSLINAYQKELEAYNGIPYTEIVENDIIASDANSNFFGAAGQQYLAPAYIYPYLGGVGIGKTVTGTTPAASSTRETANIAAIKGATLATINGILVTYRNYLNNTVIARINSVLSADSFVIARENLAQTSLNNASAAASTYNTNVTTQEQLDAIKAYNLTRESFVNTRSSQITNILGTTINQNGTTGALNIPSSDNDKLYIERAFHINARINKVFGSRRQIVDKTVSIATQQDIITTFSSALSSYRYYTISNRIIYNTSDSDYIRLEDATDFNVGDTVYFVNNNITQIQATITQKLNNNVLRVSTIIPSINTVGPDSRLYKFFIK